MKRFAFAAVGVSVALIVGGVGMVYPPAALIAAGVFGLVLLGMFGYLKGGS